MSYRRRGPIYERKRESIRAPPTSTYVSYERIKSPLTLEKAKEKFLDSDPKVVSAGIWELRVMAEEGKDVTPIFHLFPAKMRRTYDMDRGSQIRVHMAATMMHSAKSDYDISPALAIVPKCMEDFDIHVRNSAILALGYHCKNGKDIYIYLDMIARRLNDLAQVNQEAAVWTLKEYASRGKVEAHNVLQAIKDEKNNINSADVREACSEILSKG